MKHPLVNPSLSPHGFGVGNTYKRTNWKSDNCGRFNGDWGAARFWDKANRLSSLYRPVEHIVHEIMPGMCTFGRTDTGDMLFGGRWYQSHDIAVMTAIAVWLGTNCGQAMLVNPLRNVRRLTKTTEFQIRWREQEKPQSEGYMLRQLLHDCRSDTCNWGRNAPCARYHRRATKREELVLQAFLFWLGTKQGREYLADLRQFLDATSKNVYDGYKRRRDQERQARKIAQSAS